MPHWIKGYRNLKGTHYFLHYSEALMKPCWVVGPLFKWHLVSIHLLLNIKHLTTVEMTDKNKHSRCSLLHHEIGSSQRLKNHETFIKILASHPEEKGFVLASAKRKFQFETSASGRVFVQGVREMAPHIRSS